MSKEWLIDIQRKSEGFLLRLFEMTKGNPGYLVVFGEVVDGWGWTEDDCSDVQDYLTGRGLIKRESLGNLSRASFSITRSGGRWAEGKLLDTVDGKMTIGDSNSEQTDESQRLIGTDLTPRDQAIVDIYNELLSKKMPITDEIIARHLFERDFYSKREGLPYSRESVNRWRNDLIRRGYELNV